MIAVVGLTGGLAGSSAAGDFTFKITGESFTYTDAERSFGGRILQPAGNGPHPVIVFLHGQGGSPNGYPNLETFRNWGAVVVAPTLTHVAGGSTAPADTGHCPENLERGLATVDALSTQSFVDANRIAVFGHSKGAYASIGLVSALGDVVLVAALTAGGIVPDSAGTAQAAPTATEAAGITAPYLLMHGSIDGAVPPSRSQALQQQLEANGIPVVRVVYPVEHLDANQQHNLHLDPVINAALLEEAHDWFSSWHLFPPSGVFDDGFED